MNLTKDNIFDMIIIGGGATGAGIALDASSRGFKVLLLEKDDFASGTSSKSSKLIHGGVRYLESALTHLDKEQYNLVKESLYERAIFLKNTPHLAKKLKLDTPLYSYFELLYIYTGLFLYKLIAGNKSIGRSTFINKTLLSLFQPSIKKDKLKGAVSFFDGRFIDSKMVIALLQTAQEYNAEVKNYSEVKEFLYDNLRNIIGLKYEDKLTNKTYEVKSTCIVNATGISVDKVRDLDDICEETLSLSLGVHIVINKKFLPNDEGILIPNTSDGRVIFILPYLGKCLVGTTDNPSTFIPNPKANNSEIEYLINHVNKYFDIKVTKNDVLSSWSGIRPLLKNKNSSFTKQLVREHKILKSKSGLVSITGGKWTTYRKMAEELVDYVIDKKILNKLKRCKTKNLKLEGSKYSLKKTKKELERFRVSKETKESLFALYGNNAIDIIDTAYKYNAFDLIHKDLPYIKAEIIYCIKNEFVKRPIDFLSRRICLCFIDKQKALESVNSVCEVMKVQFLWTDKEEKEEKANTYKMISELF